MDNKTIAKTFRLLSQLMELHQENPYKVKSVASAAYTIDKLAFPLSEKSFEEIEKISSLGKSTAGKVRELLDTNTLQELEGFLAKTPEGVVEIMSIKGLGPKKVLVIWKELDICNIGELYYACNENRLIEAKGFGLKTQEEIKKAIEFKMANSGHFVYARAESFGQLLLSQLQTLLPGVDISFAGAYRRKLEVIERIDVLIGTNLTEELSEKIKKIEALTFVQEATDLIEAEGHDGLKVRLNFCREDDFAKELVLKTGSEAHLEELLRRSGNLEAKVLTEAAFYAAAGIPFIEPELREGLFEFDLAGKGGLPRLLSFEDLKGSLHNHSTWSDGMNTLEEMALFCRDELNLQYLGISDHSKTAFYAKGLSEERVLAQQEEIDQLNKKLAPFRIFKGIESDILFDGSLDYATEILASFDFIVASIHSVFRMSEEKATSRLIKAIENPYTTILGHPTGRLLLSRKGYPVDFKKVIDACAANGVIIEINANPLRLDIDWRWHQHALEKGVMLSVNPDAHSIKGIGDMRYGVFAARKGGVPPERCLNTLNTEEISSYFSNRKLR